MRISDWRSDVCSPDLRPVGSVGIGPEQVGADRLREDGIVYRQRDVVAGLFADALPAGADLGPVLLTDVNKEVGRVLGARRLGWNEGQFGISAQGPNEAGSAGVGPGGWERGGGRKRGRSS